MKRTVTKIIDGDTFEVTPDWKWKEFTGNRVRPTGVAAPEEGKPGYEEAKRHMAFLIKGLEVELTPIKMSYDRLLCHVEVNGEDLADLV